MDNQTKLRNKGLEGKEKYYYLKYGLNSHGNAMLGTATVCVINTAYGMGNSPLYARGVAFCNPKDQFCRKLGRDIALGRVVKAIENGQSGHGISDPIPRRTPAGILKSSGWSYFSVYDATLTEYEQKLFKLPREI